MSVLFTLHVVDDDRVSDQLYDEICERLAALAALCPSSVRLPSATDPTGLRDRVNALVAELRAADADTHRYVTALLFREAEPEPSWWRTPLGQLLAEAPNGAGREPVLANPH